MTCWCHLRVLAPGPSPRPAYRLPICCRLALRYNRICGLAKKITTKLSKLDPKDPFRADKTDGLLQKLYAPHSTLPARTAVRLPPYVVQAPNFRPFGCIVDGRVLRRDLAATRLE